PSTTNWQDAQTAQVYSPPYLFKGSRPTIAGVPGQVGYGGSFTVSTPDAASISAVALIRPAAVTHANDMDQRYVPLGFQRAGAAPGSAGQRRQEGRHDPAGRAARRREPTGQGGRTGARGQRAPAPEAVRCPRARGGDRCADGALGRRPGARGACPPVRCGPRAP